MSPPEPDQRVVEAERDRALELWVSGKDYRQIAEALGRSVATAHKRVKDALAESRRLKASEYIDVELLLYQQMQDRLIQRLEAGVAPEKIAPHLRNIQKDRRELLGLNAPKRIRVADDRAPSPEFADAVRFAERAADTDEDTIRSGESEAS